MAVNPLTVAALTLAAPTVAALAAPVLNAAALLAVPAPTVAALAVPAPTVAALAVPGATGNASGSGIPPAVSPHNAEDVMTTSPSYNREEQAAIDALVGTTPPEWNVERWMNSPPLTLAGLRGKVVLVRWWTAGCPYCSASAPALRELHRDLSPRGVVVIGMYHHKDSGPYDPRVTEKTAKEYGFTFPIAFDPDWRTFHTWMRDADPGWTSVTFLLDRKGVVRWFHPGGTYKPGDPAYAELRRTVTTLLQE